ncbi:MAG: hypothetical protein Q4A71_07740 [Actinomycetaceae bacterium]|nr:hypothetical protein [Actinomycetaceae bacterium]
MRNFDFVDRGSFVILLTRTQEQESEYRFWANVLNDLRNLGQSEIDSKVVTEDIDDATYFCATTSTTA